MATLIANGGQFTTAATWMQVSSGATSNVLTGSAYVTVTATYVASPAFTLTNGQVIDGVCLLLKLAVDAATGTLTVGLFDGAVELTTGTLTIEDLSPVDKTIDEDCVCVMFAAPQTGDGGVDYTLKLKANATTKIQAMRGSATAGDWFRVFRTTTASAAAPTTADVLFVVGEGLSVTNTVVMDETATTSFGIIYIGGKGVLSYDTTVTNTVLRLAGLMWIGCNGALRIGTVGDEIPRDHTAILEFVCASAVQYYIDCVGGEITMQGLSRSSGKNVAWALLTADMATNATTANIDTDTGWLSGDSVIITSTAATNGVGQDTVTLNADAGASSLAWTAGTTYAHKGTSGKVAEVANTTRNILVRSTSATYYSQIRLRGHAPTLDCDWVRFDYWGAAANGGIWINTGVRYDARTNITVDYCVGMNLGNNFLYDQSVSVALTAVRNCITYGTPTSAMNASASNAASIGALEFTDNVIIGGVTDVTNYGIYFFNNIKTAYATSDVSRNRISAIRYGIWFNAASAVPTTFADNVVHSYAYTTGYAMHFAAAAYGGTTHGLTAWGGCWGIVFASECRGMILEDSSIVGMGAGIFAFASHIWNLKIQNCTFRGDAIRATPLCFRFTTPSICTDISIENCNLGTTTDFTTAVCTVTGTDITYIVFKDVFFKDCTFNAIAFASGLPQYMRSLSAIGIQKHSSAPIHRTLKRTGWIEIETDTYFHAAAPSEKLTPGTYSTTTDRHQSTTRRIKVDSGATKTVSVWVYKTAAYGGSEPRLRVLTNPAIGFDTDSTLETAHGAADAWELLTGTTAAAGADGVIEVLVDCDGSTGAVYVDDWSYV